MVWLFESKTWRNEGWLKTFAQYCILTLWTTSFCIWNSYCLRTLSFTVLNMSTSAQLTFSMPADFTPASVPDALSPIAYFPYFHNTYLAVAAALNGGNILATFVGMLTSWMKEFGNYAVYLILQKSTRTCFFSFLDKPVHVVLSFLGLQCSFFVPDTTEYLCLSRLPTVC